MRLPKHAQMEGDMNTGTNSNGVGGGTEAGLGRPASLMGLGAVIAAVSGGLAILAILGGILWQLAAIQAELGIARAERARLMETLAAIERVVTENTADIKAIRTTVEANSADIKAIRTTVEANSADIKANSGDIKANSIDIAENRAALALVLKTSEENRNLLVLARGDITSLKLVQEEFGRRQQLLQASQLEFSGKLEEFGDKLTAFAETQADNTAKTRSVAARIGDFETLVVDLDGRVERLEDLLLVHQHGTAAHSGSE